MEKFRLSEKNKVLSEIKLIESLIKRNRESVDRLKGQEDSVFTRTQISKLSTGISEHESKLEALQQRQIDISAGKLDDEINNWAINTDELASMYYKTKNDNTKSKKIIIDSTITKYILNASDCRLKTRVIESMKGIKQKSSYILDKNMNFISSYLKGNELLFMSVNESEFKKKHY